eukprot:333698_1
MSRKRHKWCRNVKCMTKQNQLFIDCINKIQDDTPNQSIYIYALQKMKKSISIRKTIICNKNKLCKVSHIGPSSASKIHQLRIQQKSNDDTLVLGYINQHENRQSIPQTPLTIKKLIFSFWDTYDIV